MSNSTQSSAATGYLIGFLIATAILGAISGAFLIVAGVSGTIWGGGTAAVNYFRAFKENVIDSNRSGE